MRAVIEALEGLSNKRLARGVLWDEGRRCGCLIGSIAPRVVTATCGNTLVLGGDGRYFVKEAAQTIIKIAFANGVSVTQHKFP